MPELKDIMPVGWMEDRRPKGFTYRVGLCEDRRAATHRLAKECVELGHRLATEGKSLVGVETRTWEDHYNNACVISVEAETKLKLRQQ